MKYLFAFIITIFSFNSYSGEFGGGGASGSWDEPTDQCLMVLNGKSYSGNQFALCEQALDLVAKSYSNYPVSSFTRNPLINNNNNSYTCQVRHKTMSFQWDFNINCQGQLECKQGYEPVNGKCQPKKCPVGQTLVNGQCKQKTCPAGQSLDANGVCAFADDQCSSDQILVNGRCKSDTKKKDEDGDDSTTDLPAFCDWASEMCEWHKEWIQLSNDYASNEQKANLDREELKRLTLDSKEYLSSIDSKQELIKQSILNQTATLEQIKQLDSQFYDEIRLWLKNKKDDEELSGVEFPVFCDWSKVVCDWYLDWKDWRNDYDSNNEELQQKFDQHLEKQQEAIDQDKDFQDDVRDFFDWYKNQEQEEQTPEENNPNTPDDSLPNPEEQSRVQWSAVCPTGESRQIEVNGQVTQLQGFDYTETCETASKMRPLVILGGALIAVLIVAGG